MSLICHVWVMVIKRDAEVEFYDPYVPVIRPTHGHSHWASKKSLSGIARLSKALILVLVATNHSCVNYQELTEWAQCIVNTRNAMAGVSIAPGKVWKA